MLIVPDRLRSRARSADTWSIGLRRDRAFVQHGHLDAEVAHEGHVVLDHDHRAVAVDLLAAARRSAASRRRSCRRPARRPAAASAPAPAACRSPATASGRATGCRRRARASASSRMMSRMLSMRLVVLGAVAPEQASRAARRSLLSASSRLSSTVCISNTVGFWNLRPMPSSAISVSSSSVRSMRAVEIDVAVVGPGLAGDDVHHGGLAGAVRADDGAHLAGLDRERQVVERAEAVERHGDAVEIEQRGGGAGRPWLPHSAGRGAARRRQPASLGFARRLRSRRCGQPVLRWCRRCRAAATASRRRTARRARTASRAPARRW